MNPDTLRMLPKAVAFYRDMLGFELVAGDEAWWCMLQSGETTLMRPRDRPR